MLQMIDFNNFGFDAVYCLGLERRSDRRQHAEQEFTKNGIDHVTYFPAVDGVKEELSSPVLRLTPGMIGCYRSHQNILRLSIEKGFERICVFEDDLKLAPGFNYFMQKALPIIPDDWHFAYLGYNEYGGFGKYKTKVNDFWVVPQCAWGTQGFMINTKAAMETILKHLDNMEMQIDEQLANIVLPGSGLNYYAIFPSVVDQAFKELGSDIQDSQKLRK